MLMTKIYHTEFKIFSKVFKPNTKQGGLVFMGIKDEKYQEARKHKTLLLAV